MKLGRKFAGLTVALNLGFGAFCEIRAQEPAGYYDAATGLTGGELKQSLNQIIRRDNRYGLPQHTVIPYNSLFQPLREIWRDPANPSNILLAYSSPSVLGTASTWNREHLWPRSRGNTDQMGPDDSDLFYVVPADSQVNSLRNNRYFDLSDPSDPGYVIPALGSAPQASYDSNSWQPAPDERGDIARALFYVDVRYNGTEANTTDMELVSFAPSGSQMGNLNTLLLWHAEDPPDDAERARNDLIYSNYQGNRNPFIDHPEYVAAIWGTGIPGDPQNVPLARVEAASASASESPSSPARFVVSLNQFAGTGGLVVNFFMSGTASFSEYSLSGDVLSFDPATGIGTLRVQQGYATGLVILAPVADGVAENAETAVLTLAQGTGYSTTPDASSFATATLSDSPSLPVYWNFDNVTATNKSMSANQGFGFVSLSNFTGVISSFSGVNGSSSLGLGGGGNNSWIDFNFSMTGYRDLLLSFYTRGTASGFTTGLWSFSTNGVNFVTNMAVNTATTSTTFTLRTVDFSSFSWLNNASSVTMRYTLSGATNTGGNNRIDELTFSATQMVTGDGLREASVIASASTGLESPAIPAVFSLRLNGLAPAGGLTVAFELSGTAAAADYALSGVQTWDPTSRSGTVFFPENEDTAFIGIQPVDDGVTESRETVVITLPAPLAQTYLLGANTTATAAIRDRKLNDNFADAYVLEGLPVNTVGDNVGATRETGEPWHYSTTGSCSVWWTWTAPATATVSISTASSTFDTILAVYTGTTVNSLAKLASDDDSGGGTASRVTFSAVAGTTYQIAVDGYGSANGQIALGLAQITTPTISSFTPTSGVPGTLVTINGFNFAGANDVKFGGVSAASLTVVSDNQIVAVVPESAGSGAVSVVSSNGTGQSASWFSVAKRPSVASATPDRASLGAFTATQGNASASSTFSVSGASLPGPLRIAAPTGFEVSLDGLNFTNAVEISAPERSDRAANYSAGWTNGANAGYGFMPWSISVSQGTSGLAGAALGNPEESGVFDFGAQAFSPFASPASSRASAWVRRGFTSVMSIGETASFRWAVNWDPNTSTGGNYVYVYSGGALLFTVRHGNFPGQIFFSTPNSASVDTGIPYGDRPMTWTMTLLGANTLRVSATGRDGSSQVFFSRDIAVSGAPDAIGWYAYQLDPDIRRRAYFNDLRIDSASLGGGQLPVQTVYVRLAANAPVGSVSGAVGISSAGQSLASIALNGTVTGMTAVYDAWAQSHGLDPQGNGLRGADADGDGHSNLHEFLFGGVPTQATSSLWRHEMQPSGLVLTFVGRATGAVYKLMSTGNLAAGAWTEEALAITETQDQDGVLPGHKRRQVIVPTPTGNRFFRLQAAEIVE